MEKDLPKGWAACKVGDFLQLKNGYAFKSKDYKDEGVPLIRISDIQSGYVTSCKSICIEEDNIKDGFYVEHGDVLIAMSGATTGKYGIFIEDKKVLQNQRVGNLKPLVPKSIDKKYIYYFLGSLKEEIEKRAYGAAQPNISPKLIEGIDCFCPPLHEQKRIVAKLDTLFASLENTKARLEKIPILIKNFKQAILIQAVTGKLTNSQFNKTTLSKAVTFIGGGTPSKSESKFWNGKIPWASVKDFKNNRVLRKTQDCITQLGLDSSSAKLADKGELLLITRMSPGRTVITDIEVAINQDLKIIRPSKEISLSFISYWFESNIHLIESLSTGTTVKGIRVDVLNKLEIPIPTIQEQTEIVRRVESLFAKADAIEAQYTKLKQKVDTLPQAILAKAFRGELVEQNPLDEPASVLLEKIQSLRQAQGSAKSKKKVVRKKKSVNP